MSLPLFIATLGITLLGVTDGDTIKARLENVVSPINKVSIRLNGIDTPEIHGKCDNEKAMAQEAKKFLNDKLQQSSNIELKNIKWDKYGGRILADLLVDNVNIAELMIKSKLAVGYNGEKKTVNWCNQ